MERLEGRVAPATVSWTNPGSGNWDDAANWSTLGVPGAGDDVVISTPSAATVAIQKGDSLSIASLTTGSADTLSVTGGSLTVTAGASTLAGPLAMTGGSLTATGPGVTLTATGTTTASAASLFAAGGATASFPQLTSYRADGSTFQADGAGSVLDVSALATFSQQGTWSLIASNQGEVKLTGLSSLASSSSIDFQDTGGGTILDGNLTSLSGRIQVSLDGSDAHVADSWARFTGGTLKVTGGSYTLPGLGAVDGSSLSAWDGGTLALPGLTSYAPNGTFEAINGGVLDVSALTTLTEASGPWTVDANNGGTVNLGGLTSLTGGSTFGGIHLYDTGGSRLLDGKVTSVLHADVTLDGSDPQATSAWTRFASGSLTLYGQSLALPNLTDLEDANLQVGGGVTLDLSSAGASTLAGNISLSFFPGTLTVSGSPDLANATVLVSNGATLSLPDGAAFTGRTTLEATDPGSTVDLASTGLAEPASPGSALLVEALSGGSVSLPELTSISGGPVVLLCSGANSTISLPALETFTSPGGGSASNGGSLQAGIPLPGAPDVWIGSGSSAWHTGSNWLLGSAPPAGMNVLIDTGTAATVLVLYGDVISVQNVTLGDGDTLEIGAYATLSTTGSFTSSGILDLDAGGKLNVVGGVAESPSATINEQIGGTPASNQFGVLDGNGAIALGGTFNLTLVKPYAPVVGQDFPVISFGSSSGSFSSITGLDGAGSSFRLTTQANSIDLVVQPTPPSFTADTPPVAGVGSAYSYPFQANGSAPITFSATGLPGWARIDPTTGILSGTPPAAGTFHFSVTASNGIAPDATVDVTLTAQIGPPTFTAAAPPVALGGSFYTYPFQATGTGTHPITYSASGLPSWARLDPNTGTLSGTPPSVGTFAFSVTASNGISPDTTVNVSLTVAGGTAMTINVPAGTTFTVPDGTYGGGTTFNVGAGATLTIASGTFTGGCIFNVAAGAVVALTGGRTLLTYSGLLTGSGAGTVQLSGPITIGVGGLTLDFPAGMFGWTGGSVNSDVGDLTNLGTIGLSGDATKLFFRDGTLDNRGTIVQTGAGSLDLHGDGVTPTTLKVEAGGVYLLDSDAGVSGDVAAIDNAGTIRKTGGPGTSPLSFNGTLNNTGVIEADSGTLSLDAHAITQVSGTTLTGGTWNALNGATLQFPGGTGISGNAAAITLGGSGAAIAGLSGLNANSGSFTLTNGATFTTTGPFSNAGSLTLGAGSRLSVGGAFTQTPTGTLTEQVGGTPASGQYGQATATGTATLGGAFKLVTANGFTAAPGQDFPVLTCASAGGTFSTVLGLGSTFSEAINPTSLDLYAFRTPADLQVSDVSAPATATPGQPLTVTWKAANHGPAAAAGSWQDSVYLSTTPAVTAASVLLGTALHTGGLAVNAAYTSSWSGAMPALFPGNYHVVVQVDSLYQVSDPDRSSSTMAANTGPVSVSVPTLALGAPVGASFTDDNSDFYYRITAGAGNSLLLALSGSPALADNAIYVSLNGLPTTYQFDSRSGPTAGANPTLAVPATQGGTYYVLVHHQAGPPGAFHLTASLPGLTVLAASPGTVGNAGQATLTVRGLDLEPNTTCTLTGPGGTLTAASAVYGSSALAYVTFDFTGVAVGTYDLEAVNGDGTTSTLPGAVQVTAGGGADVVASLVTPNPVRVGRTGVLYVEYANTGNDDAGAPLLTLISTPGIPIGLDANRPPSEAEVQVLGINRDGPAGVLPPGATYRFPVYFTAGLSGPIDFELDVGDTTNSQALDWDAVEPRVSAGVTGAASWPAVLGQLQHVLGSTWGQYVRVLDHYATILPAGGGDPANPIDVLGLAVDQAVAAVGTSISGVAAGTAPGVLLAGNTITAINGTTGDGFTTNILNDGSFVFPTLPAGSYTFSVPGDLVHGSPGPVTVNAGQAVTGVAVTLDPEVTLGGQVTGGGVPVAGADVSVWSGATLVTDVQAGANGVYAATFPAGSYTLVVSAPGLARSYSSVTLAAGPQALNMDLAAGSAVSGSVSLSDGQSIQRIDVVGVLHGNGPLPDFGAKFTGGSFLLDSLAPGVYDFSISAPDYNPVSIPDVQVGQGQTVDLGAVQLTPVDPAANALDADIRNTWYYGLAAAFVSSFHCGPDAAKIISEYFIGPGVAEPFRVPGMIAEKDYNYPYSTVPNDPVEITDSTDVSSFQNNPSTKDALEFTLALITASGLEDLPKVKEWLTPFKTNGTIPESLTLDASEVMKDLGLRDLQSVYEGSPWAGLWHFQGGDGIATYLAGGVGSGGPPPAAAVPIPDSRIITGTLTLSVSCDGTVKVEPDFHVDVNDTFDFDPASIQAWFLSFGTLAHLEALDMTADVPFHVDFDAPPIDPGHFSVPPPDRRPCMSQPSDCTPADKTSWKPVTTVMAQDPNALVGPAGYGTRGFIRPAGPLPYTVDFENDGSAAAQDVTVTEQLDPGLDWSTFQLGSFGFGPVTVAVPAGLTQYQATVAYRNADGSPLGVHVALDFNVQTGLLTASFNSLDPATGLAPAGAFDGFLPPDDGSHAGEGDVTYTVQPRPNLAAGTPIQAQAGIVFDTNDPLATNTTLNTVDDTAPTSSVTAPAFSAGTFTVSWSGRDNAGGSGIAGYDVFVSDNGGPFQPWLTDTSQTSAPFTGQGGHTYAFYSVASDNVGNVQPTPSSPPARTQVLALPAGFSYQNGTLRVTGTEGNDTFSFSAGSVYTVTLNHSTYQASPALVHAIVFIGGGGSDTATLTDKGKAQFTLRPGTAHLAGKGYTVDISGVKTTNAFGGSAGTVTLYDSKGNDAFVSTPKTASLRGGGFRSVASGFGKVAAYSTAGKDTATLTGSSGADTFAGKPATATLTGKGYSLVLNHFAVVNVSGGDGSDTATLTAGKGSNTVTASGNKATLIGPGYSLGVSKFHKVTAVATAGGKNKKVIHHPVDFVFATIGPWS